MSPGTPFAGSDVHFAAAGLEPWDILEVTFIEPNGQEAGWVADAHYTQRWTTNYFLADRNGEAHWTRYGAQDQAGDWTVHVRIDDTLSIIRYSYRKFAVPRQVHVQLGAPLFGCRSDEAVIFFSDSVNFAVTVDLHARLEFAADLMERELGVRTSAIPVIYMLGNQADFERVQRASGEEPGWEAGFFRSYGDYQGIFIQSDKQKTDVYHTLTHEYVHFLLDEISGGADLPAWVNEGLAEYYEYAVGRQGDFPDASYARMLRSGDTARDAAVDNRLLPLSQLESQREWGQRDISLVPLQYTQSHMAVRYLIAQYGQSAPIEIVRQIASGADLDAAIPAVTGVGYPQFESDFRRWLANWDDPVRASVRPYLATLDDLADEQEAIYEMRREAIREWNLNFDRVQSKAASAVISERAERLLQRANALTPAPYVGELHDSATSYFRILSAWLAEDLGFLSDGLESSRLAANAMIPEVTYRSVDFRQRLSDTKFILNLH